MSLRMTDRFGLLLVLVLATLCAQGLVDVRGNPVGALVTHGISGLALVVAVRVGAVARRWRHAADALVLVTLGVNLAVVAAVRLGGMDEPALGGELAWVVAACLVPLAMARRVVAHEVTTVESVMGAVAAYLQIAVAYASVFRFLDQVSSSEFFGKEVATTEYTYASLQTITTLGYGDLAPVTDLGRLVAVSEAVLGQVFLVTFVALVVTRFAAPDRESGQE